MDNERQQLEAIFNTLGKGGQPTKNANLLFIQMTEKITKLVNQQKLSTKATDLYTQALKLSIAANRDLTADARNLAESLAEDAGILTDAQEKAHKSNMSTMAQAAAALQATGGDQKAVAVLTATRSNAELKMFESGIQQQRNYAQALTQSGDVLGGMKSGMSATFQEAGGKAARFASQMTGASAETLGQIAMVVGGVALAFAAVAAVVQRGAELSVAGSEAGFKMNGIIGQQITQMGLLQQQVSWSFANAVSATEAYKLLAIAGQNYSLGLFATGKAYQDVTATMGAFDARNELRMGLGEFVVEAAAVGKSIGMTLEDGVKMASRLAVASKGGAKDATLAFAALAQHSERLGIPMGELVDITTVLAERNAYLGGTAREAAAQTLGMVGVIREMTAANVKGTANMDPEKTKKWATALATALTNMDQYRMAAVTQRPGESIFDTLARNEGGQVTGKLEAIKGVAAAMGLNLHSPLSGGSEYERSLALAKGSGMDMGNPEDTVNMGRLLTGFVKSGQFNEESLKEAQARMTQDRLDSSKSVGQQQAGGANVMNIIANTLSDILTVIVEGVNTLTFATPHSSEYKELMSKRTGKGSPEPSAAAAGAGYGGSMKARRNTRQTF